MTTPVARSAASAPPSIGFNLLAIAALVALAAIAFAYWIDAAEKPETPAGSATLVRTLGGRDFEIPVSWFRYAEQRVEGFARQIDLTLTLPLGPEGAGAKVEVTLLPSSRVRPSASLLDGVYLHQFTEDVAGGPAGLIGKRLKATDGYAGETVWFDPISSEPFVAKCADPVAGESPRTCLRSVRLAPGIAAVYVFDANSLANWQQFDPAVRAALARIGL